MAEGWWRRLHITSGLLVDGALRVQNAGGGVSRVHVALINPAFPYLLDLANHGLEDTCARNNAIREGVRARGLSGGRGVAWNALERTQRSHVREESSVLWSSSPTEMASAPFSSLNAAALREPK
jgi:hypothetical protein